MDVKKTVAIYGVPSDLGANILGSNMGPTAIRIAGLKNKIKEIGHEAVDHGDLVIPIRDTLGPEEAATCYINPIKELCLSLAECTYQAMCKGEIPLSLGGDHSLAIGSISGISRYWIEQKKTMGLIWVDAHADMNTPKTTESGNIHGMPLATVLGDGHPQLVDLFFPGAKVKPENVALVGIRNLDPTEKRLLKASKIRYYTMRDIDERGLHAIMKEALAAITKTTDGLHVSFDIDGVDPLYAPGVSTPVPGGLSFREAHLLLEMVAETGRLSSMDFVELNPFTDQGAQSANLTVELILSALGKAIV